MTDFEELKRHRDEKNAERRAYAMAMAEINGENFVEPAPVADADLDAVTRAEGEALQAAQARRDWAETPEYKAAKARYDAAAEYVEANGLTDALDSAMGLGDGAELAEARAQMAEAERAMAYPEDLARAQAVDGAFEQGEGRGLSGLR